MIFGFNTDIRVGENVFHVQSEARVQDLVLETQVFQHGHCIGKRVVPYTMDTDEAVQELLRAQHRWIIDSARDGFLEDALQLQVSLAELTPAAQPKARPSTPSAVPERPSQVQTAKAGPSVVPSSAKPAEKRVIAPDWWPVIRPSARNLTSLRIEFLGAPRMELGVVVLQFCLFLGKKRAGGVGLTAAWTDDPTRNVAQSTAGADGVAIMRVPYSSLAETSTLTVSAAMGDTISSKRFRIRFETH